MTTEWNSFERVDAVFNREIPDRVPKFEISIEIPELHPLADSQNLCQRLRDLSSPLPRP